MRHSIEFWIIMSLTTLIVLCAVLIACSPADAARGCLDREQAARTWPQKQLGIDDDGCFTYMRRGIKPAPDRPMVAADDIASATAEAGVALDMLQRWPSDIIELKLTPYEPFKPEPEPWVSPRNMAAAIFSVVLFCAVLEVLVGGWFAKLLRRV